MLPLGALGAIEIGTPIFPIVILLLGLILVVQIPLFEQIMERVQLRRYRYSGSRAMREFGPCWLGIYSEDDEAINGLKGTLDIRATFVPRRTLPKKVYYADRIMPWTRPIRWLINFFYNLTVPVSNRFFSSMIRNTSQGNDRPGTVVMDISPGPIECAKGYFPIPAPLNKRLVDTANSHAAQLVPQLRVMLGRIATSEIQLLEDIYMDSKFDKALVHTSYFSNDNILKLIVWHISQTSHLQANLEQVELDDSLRQWLVDFKTKVKKDVIEQLPDK